MKALTRVLLMSALAVVFGMMTTFDASAQTPESSQLLVTEPLDVGGTILEPGSYLIRVLPGFGNRNLLQVTNADRTKIFATALSIPHPLPAGTDQSRTEYVLYPAIEGTPRALRTWYSVNSPSNGGHDIIYSERRAMELAPVVKEPVVAYKGDVTVEQLNTAPLVVVTPEKVVIAYVEPAPPPKPVVVAKVAELPGTAGRLPLFAAIGLLFIGAAVGVRALRVV